VQANDDLTLCVSGNANMKNKKTILTWRDYSRYILNEFEYVVKR